MGGCAVIENAPNAAALFQAAFALGFCVGLVVAAVIWWQIATRTR